MWGRICGGKRDSRKRLWGREDDEEGWGGTGEGMKGLEGEKEGWGKGEKSVGRGKGGGEKEKMGGDERSWEMKRS